MVSNSKNLSPHILVYPFCSSGHVIPLLDLTERLLTRGATVTVLVTPNNATLLQPITTRHPSTAHALIIPVPEDPSYTTSANGLLSKIRVMYRTHYPALLQWFKSHHSPPIAMISDFFLGWTLRLASELGIPRVVFSPSAAFALSVEYSLYKDLPKNLDGKMDFEVNLKELPNSPSYPWWQISLLYRKYVRGDSDMEFHRDGMLANMKSWGILFNSFTELEPDYIDYMKKIYGPSRVWAVGPLLPPVDDSNGPENRGGSSSIPSRDVLTWLDARKDRSVVYVCFGSRTVLTNQEMSALARALEISGVNFIWCVREARNGHVAGDHGMLPHGFEDRTSEKGLIIRGWAPQVLILRHRAVGAFLTHCGWNSTLEGITAGVVMLTWPMGADQFTDAKLLVDQLGVAIRAHEGDDESTPDPVELARVLTDSIDQSRPERIRAVELSQTARAAVNGGSSDKYLHGFIEALHELKLQKEECALGK